MKGNKKLNSITDSVSEVAEDVMDNILDNGGKVVTKALLPLILKIVLGIALVGGIGFGVKKAITRRPLKIADTANVISEIKKIGEFTTACYYEEMVVKEERIDTAYILFGHAYTNHNEIVIMGKGRVRAGFDLKKISEGDLTIHGDTLDIVLPQAEIFDIIMNPSDFITEYEEGKWSHESTKPLKIRAKQQLEQDALDCGLIERATMNGRKRLKSLFAVFGFNTVNITIKDN